MTQLTGKKTFPLQYMVLKGTVRGKLVLFEKEANKRDLCLKRNKILIQWQQ